MDAAIYISTNGGVSYTPLTAPAEFAMSIADIDNSSSGRPASGKMIRSVVRGGATSVRKLEMKWANVSASDVKAILNLVKGTYFYLRYYDLLDGAMRSAEFYAGDRKITIKRIRDGIPFISELSFNCIER